MGEGGEPAPCGAVHRHAERFDLGTRAAIDQDRLAGCDPVSKELHRRCDGGAGIGRWFFVHPRSLFSRAKTQREVAVASNLSPRLDATAFLCARVAPRARWGNPVWTNSALEMSVAACVVASDRPVSGYALWLQSSRRRNRRSSLMR